MALPETVKVKLSSEAAGCISITPVVVQTMATRELIEHMLGLAGKDVERIRELLLRGTLVSGASRFRWQGWPADRESVQELLATFPDPNPDRAFARELCVRAILRGGRQAIDIPREAGVRKLWLKRTSFWDLLMEVLAAGELRYCDYSYRERADYYRSEVPTNAARRLREASGLLKYTTLREQIRNGGFDSADLYVLREPPLP